MIGLLVAVTVLAATDPCAPIEAASSPDSAVAAAYFRVARDEEKRGAVESAKVAYAQALSFDPHHPLAKASLARLCSAPPAPTLDAALEKMNAGDRAGAVEILRALPANARTASAALLEGILQYELERDALAAPLLRDALKDPELADSANLFLGLIALRAGEASLAENRFRAVSQTADPVLRSSAAGLLRLSARDGRIILSGALEGGYDSNANVAPGTQLLSSDVSDAFAGVAFSAMVRPWLQKGPYLMLRGGYRSLPHLHSNDTGVASGLLGWQLGDKGLRGSGEYQFEVVAFGEQLYLYSHALFGRLQLPLGRALLTAESATYFEHFVQTQVEGFSGIRPTGRVAAGWYFTPELYAELSYGGSRDFAQDSALAYLDHGPGLRARWTAMPTLRLSAAVEYRQRNFDGVDPDLLVSRADTTLDVGLRVELDMSPSWALFASVWAWRSTSNVPELGYLRLVGSAGITFTEGFL